MVMAKDEEKQATNPGSRHSQDSDKTMSPSPSQASHLQLLSIRGVVTDEILNEKYEGSGTDDDPYIISFLDNDPGDPKQLPAWKKWSIVASVSICTFIAALGSSIWVGILREVEEYTGTSEEVAILGLSLFLLGFVVGPLLWAPCAEHNGRQFTFFVSFLGYTAFTAGTIAAQNIQTMLVLRFFAGCFAACPFVNSNGNLADIFEPAERGLAFGFYAATPFLGPVLGPMVGGFLGTAAGWRWVMALLSILAATALVVGMLLIPETYGTIILYRRARTMSKITGKRYVSHLYAKSGFPKARTQFKTALSRPWAVLFTDPIVLCLSLWISCVYGTLYLFVSGYPYVYEQARGWSPGVSGLALLGIGGGVVTASMVNIPVSKHFAMKARRDQGHPEVRLLPSMVGAILIPIGIFWFAFSNSPSLPWPASVFAGSFFGMGMVLVWTSVSNFLADAYKIYASSALAGQVVMRSVFGAVFPLFTGYMYKGIGIHWASAVPGFLAVLLAPLPFLLYRYGMRIRQKSKFASKADADTASLRNRGSV